MSTKLGKDIDKVLDAKIGKKKTLVSKWCTPTGTRVMDVLHGVSLLAVLGTALWNMVLTMQGQATVEAMKPVFITTLIAAIIKIPSQVCAAQGRLGGWMTVAGSVITVIITAILIGYLTFDPKYANDTMEDACVVVHETDSKGKTSTKCFNSTIESSKINVDATSNPCKNVGECPSQTFEVTRRRGPHTKAHWSPIFHA
jgi:hypothetical protein